LDPISTRRKRQIHTNPGRGGCGIVALAELTAPPSHDLVKSALDALGCMEHRGGCLDGTGDGAGLLFQPERAFFEPFIAPNRTLPQGESLMVGTVWFLRGERNRRELQRDIDGLVRREGLTALGWRDVPVNSDVLGVRAREDMPFIAQVFIGKGHRLVKHLAVALRSLRVRIEEAYRGQIAVPSMSERTTVYKALASSSQLVSLFPDLRDQRLTTRVVIGHRRYATNTFSNWHLVQPFRLLAHNGEINTIRANERAVVGAEGMLGGHGVLLRHGSDSAQLDRAVDFLSTRVLGSLPETMRRLLSPNIADESDARVRRYLEASRRMLGTLGVWEGPAGLLATDGRQLVAQLDRMGLRPLRWVRTRSGRLIVASEMGVVPVAAADIADDGQLEPGGMLIVDLDGGELIKPETANAWIVSKTRLGFTGLATTDLLPLPNGTRGDELPVEALQCFGWTRPRAIRVREIVKGGREPVHSMGNDTPLAIFSENHSRIYSFLHQVVAVVTNPAVDPIREGRAMDTAVFVGCSPTLRDQRRPGTKPQYRLEHPVLSEEQVSAIVDEDNPDLKACIIDATFERGGSPQAMVRRLHGLADDAVQGVRSGAGVLVISDRRTAEPGRLPLPTVFVVCHLHRRLTQKGLRRQISVIVETGSVHESHDLAVLIAYGATAVSPYAMLQLARATRGLEPEEAEARLIGGLVKGLRRIMSKMGITSVAGYRGSVLFEAVGLAPEVVDYYLPGTPTRVGGLTMADIHADIEARTAATATRLPPNRNTAIYRKEVTNALQLVARNGNSDGDYDRFISLLNDTPPVYLRDLLTFTETEAIDTSRVVSASEIIRTILRGAAMSHGALHATAHRAIAAAFNDFGSRSNSGEGGEDPRRNPGCELEADRNRTRQVASGRFGVDAAYLVGADELEIKIGQGAKPGEGGHLPANKVTAEIAAIRKTQTGVALISPPPHHDIYSIEDLAQLVRNLRTVNPTATIAVKIPSVTNLGTIAVGVAKAGAMVITVSGFEGGTGAASSGSILHAGLPLEHGLTDAHQYLCAAGIRHTVRLRADGGIKCGRDVAMCLALGADEVAFGTPLMVAENCVFCRGCNHGRCPVGLATQDEERQDRLFMRRGRENIIERGTAMRTRYDEARAGVKRYLLCLAEDIRGILASLGLTSPAELTGRVDLLRQIRSDHPRWSRLDLSELLVDLRNEPRSSDSVAIQPREDPLTHAAGTVSLTLTTSDQAVGGTLAGKFAGNSEEREPVRLLSDGFAGQGLGFAATTGMTIRHAGYANDCVGEVMGAEARIVLVPPAGWGGSGVPHLAGNAVGYGATGGELYIAGRVGQRVGVRNSGASLVCEGAGKYAFEYMTGGIGVVLGSCGADVAMGQTGGVIFLLDGEGVPLENDDTEILHDVLQRYAEATSSATAAGILAEWPESARRFRVRKP